MDSEEKLEYIKYVVMPKTRGYSRSFFNTNTKKWYFALLLSTTAALFADEILPINNYNTRIKTNKETQQINNTHKIKDITDT